MIGQPAEDCGDQDCNDYPSNPRTSKERRHCIETPSNPVVFGATRILFLFQPLQQFIDLAGLVCQSVLEIRFPVPIIPNFACQGIDSPRRPACRRAPLYAINWR